MTQIKVGRPNKFNRDHAIELAKNAFWKQGYNALSISQLSTIMGITRSSFYNSFTDKQGLFKEVLAQYKTTEPYILLLDVPESVKIKTRFTVFFKEICRTRVHDQGNQGCLIVNTVSGVIGSEDKLADDIEALLRSSIELFEHLLQRGISQGELPVSYPIQTTANALVAFNMGLNNLTKVVRDEDQLWNICDDFLKNYNLT